MSQKIINRTCEICGDIAYSRNYVAITCESCKAFFRRHALKDMPLKCYNNSKCVITIKTRKLCQKCRLEKCYEKGMRKECIKSIEENKMRRELIEENRQKQQKLMVSMSSQKLYISDLTDTLSTTNETLDNISIDELIDSSVNLSDEELEHQIMDIVCYDQNNINPLIAKNCNTFDKNDMKCIFTPISKCLTDYKGLNDLETNRVSELLNAMNILHSIKYSKTKFIKVKNFEEMTIITSNKIENYIKDIISFAKSLNGFQNICADDQLILTKYGVFEVMMFESIDFFKSDSNKFISPFDGEHNMIVDLNIFKMETIDYIQIFKDFVVKFFNECSQDSFIKNMLTAIILFNPKRPNLKHSNNVKLEQQIYIYLLERYLLLKYESQFECQTKLVKIINLLNDFDIILNIQRIHGFKCFGKYLHNYGPLYRELSFKY